MGRKRLGCGVQRAFIGHKMHKRHRKDGGCPREMEVWEETEDASKRCESDRWEGAEGSACGTEIGDRKAEKVESRASRQSPAGQAILKDGGTEDSRGLIFQWIVHFNPGKALEISVIGPHACPLLQRVSGDQCIGGERSTNASIFEKFHH